MITMPAATDTISTRNIDKLLYDDKLIDQLAIQLVANHVECHIDMAADMGDEISTFADADAHIQCAKLSVEDYVADLLTEFREQLYSAIRRRTIEVKSVKIGKDGMSDADVDIR